MNWVILILISAFFVGVDAIVVKKELVKNRSLPVLFLVSILSFALMGFFYSEINLNLPLGIYALILLKTIIISISWLCIYQAYKYLEISTVAPLKNLSPIFLIILSIIFLGESLTAVQFVGVGLILFAGYSLEIHSIHHLLEPLKLFKNKYFIYILISLIGISFSAIIDKTLVKSIDFYTLLFVFFGFISVIYFILLIIKKEFTDVKIAAQKSYVLIILIAVLALCADFSYFMAISLPATMISLAIPLRRFSTFISTVLGGRLFNEKHLLFKAIVCVVMIVGIYLIVS